MELPMIERRAPQVLGVPAARREHSIHDRGSRRGCDPVYGTEQTTAPGSPIVLRSIGKPMPCPGQGSAATTGRCEPSQERGFAPGL